MEVEKSRPKPDKPEEYETYTEEETVNSMVPLWRRNKSELKPEDYNSFYKEKFFDFEDPLRVIHSSTGRSGHLQRPAVYPRPRPL